MMREHDGVRVSLIVPVYNVAAYIGECLDSIVGQTMRQIEVICIDDASPDESAEIVRRYQARDERIKLLVNEKNLGVAASRNRGIEAASGEFLYIIDSDDYLEPEAVEKMHSKASEENLDFVISDAWVRRKDGDGEYLRHPFHGLVRDDWPGCAAWYYMFRRQLVVDHPELRFPAGAHPMEDGVFSFMLMSLAGPHGEVAEALIHYRQHQDMRMERVHDDGSAAYIRSLGICIDRLVVFMQKHDELSDARKLAGRHFVDWMAEAAEKCPGSGMLRLSLRSRWYRAKPELMDRLIQKKTTSSGRLIIKIMRAPVLWIRPGRGIIGRWFSAEK